MSPSLPANTRSQLIIVPSPIVRMRYLQDWTDLSKTKYGGPFTTEQVEDVNVFYGILRILFSLGTLYLLEFSLMEESAIFKWHIYKWNKMLSLGGALEWVFVDGRLLYLLAVVFLYPMYIIIVRPFISYYIP